MSAVQSQFLSDIKPVALLVEMEWGVKPIILITQAAHESGWGASSLTVEANNLFGMMAGTQWLADKLPIIEKPTVEMSKIPPEKIRYWERPGDVMEKKALGNGWTRLLVVRAFRKYPSWEASAQDWAKKIATRPVYAKAYEAAKEGDLVRFAGEISLAGYATDPDYQKKILALGPRIGEALA